MKKFFVSMFAALMCMTAFAADTMKGVNQSGVNESVGFDFIATAKHSGGVTSYQALYSYDVYTLSDANGSQYNKWLAWAGANAKASTVSGWTYNAAKAKFSCQNSVTVVSTPGRPGWSASDNIADNCQLYNSI